MSEFIKMNLQLFAEAGNVVNASGNVVNAYTGVTTAFAGADDMSATMKTFYSKALLKNARDELVFGQFGEEEALPANSGKTIEWRKFNTLPDAQVLQEGVIPTGRKIGMSTLTAALVQNGDYVAMSDVIQNTAIDNILLNVTEELGAAAGRSIDKLNRAALMLNTNIIFADAINKNSGDAYVSTPTSRATLTATREAFCGLTPEMIMKANTNLAKNKARKWENCTSVAIIHPSVSHDLRLSRGWIEAHKYAKPEEIFKGEIGMIDNTRFVLSTLAPVIKVGSIAVYQVIFLGKNAYKVVKPEGMGLEMIFKKKEIVGGPLNQFSTAGYKFSHAAKIVYPESIVAVECVSSYSASDQTNI